MARRRTQAIPTQRRVHLLLRLYRDLKANPYSQQPQQAITFRLGPDSAHDAIEAGKPDQYTFEPFLARFQQLIKDDDPVFLPKILNQLPRHVDNAELRGAPSQSQQAVAGH